MIFIHSFFEFHFYSIHFSNTSFSLDNCHITFCSFIFFGTIIPVAEWLPGPTEGDDGVEDEEGQPTGQE